MEMNIMKLQSLNNFNGAPWYKWMMDIGAIDVEKCYKFIKERLTFLHAIVGKE